jgi:hypothetical protein
MMESESKGELKFAVILSILAVAAFLAFAGPIAYRGERDAAERRRKQIDDTAEAVIQKLATRETKGVP